jgi:DNA (cytosine-5)-methyltransferase 1
VSPRIGSLCSGYGGLEMGVRAALGGSVAWHAEIDHAACRVLSHRWPGVRNLGDVTGGRWAEAEPVDLVAVGFPCQSVAAPGRRAGLVPVADERGQLGLLPTRAPWEGVTEAIRALRPRLVIIENVRGLLSAPVSAVGPNGPGVAGGAFGRVLGDLVDLGYDAEWLCAGADELAGAPHRRRRVFVAAVAADARGEERARWARLRPSGSAELGRGRPDDGALAPADEWGALRPAVDRWSRVVGRGAPAGLVLGPTGGLVTSARFIEWAMGLPEGHVTAVPGVSEYAQRRLLGNGVVPQQAEAAVRVLLPRLLAEEVAA